MSSAEEEEDVTGRPEQVNKELRLPAHPLSSITRSCRASNTREEFHAMKCETSKQCLQ